MERQLSLKQQVLLVVLAAVPWRGVVTWDPEAGFFTCDNMVHNTSDHAPLFNCTHDDSEQVFRCEVVLATTGKNFHANTNLAVSLQLRRDAAEPRCLLLAAVNVSQVPQPALPNTIQFGDLEDNIFYQQIQHLRVAVVFPRSVPFGRLCTEESPYRPSACLNRDTVLVSAVIRHATATRKGVLNRLHYMHNATLMLGAELMELRAEVNGEVELQLQQVLDLLAGTKARSVALHGGNWSDAPLQLSEQPLLTDLDLASCRIANVNITDFGLVPRLRSLVLHHNSLQDVPAGLQALAELQRLDLSDNPLQNTDSVHVLGSLAALRELRLAGCGLKALPEQLALPAGLQLLDLSRNGLEQLPPPLPPALRRLLLHHNQLTAALRLTLHAGAPPLLLVDLADNLIDQPVEVLRGDKKAEEPWTEWLNLSWNQLQTLPRSDARRLKRSASHAVVLHDNPWDCYVCETAPLKDWILQPEDEKPAVVGEVFCAKPAALAVRSPTVLDGCSSVDIAVAVGVPMAALGLLAGLVAALCYSYRFELTYLRHILGVKIGAARRGRRRPGAEGAADDHNFKYDAFVSYSASDREWVLYRLLPGLERAPERFRLCLHERDFAPGTFITINIVSSMQASRRMIVVLSEAFVSSQWCQWELDMAKHQVWEDGSDFLLLLELERLERRRLPRHLRDFMETRTYLEWPARPAAEADEAAAWAKLRDALSPSLHQQRQRARQLQRAASQRRRHQLHRDHQLHQLHGRRPADDDADDACSDVTQVTSA
ncbi:toll-like receptor 2 isoform X2 [Schistocerca gregaria]|uniref:toll-like receptor 2 isoform X2 n=1 Tax=Schistocerca gregaria TaxID=7010 RepID=UPI00211E2BC2|nr:toll-like receptor 2 isoform X2 [Schistocerca gregaria]